MNNKVKKCEICERPEVRATCPQKKTKKLDINVYYPDGEKMFCCHNCFIKMNEEKLKKFNRHS